MGAHWSSTKAAQSILQLRLAQLQWALQVVPLGVLHCLQVRGSGPEAPELIVQDAEGVSCFKAVTGPFIGQPLSSGNTPSRPNPQTQGPYLQ